MLTENGPEGSRSTPGEQRIRVLFVDDHEMVGQSLAAIVGDETDIEVVGIASTASDGLRLAGETHPDVVVMDYRLGDGDGVQATRQLRSQLPDVNVVMLTATADDHVLEEALEAGCCGFVAKGARVEDLIGAVRAAAAGDSLFSPEIVGRLVRIGARGARPELSVREQEVLQLVAGGQAAGAIAATLGLSQHTARNHIRNLLTKLGAHSKLEAVVIAARSGLIELPQLPRLP